MVYSLQLHTTFVVATREQEFCVRYDDFRGNRPVVRRLH